MLLKLLYFVLGDSLELHDGMKFSTYDQDNDEVGLSSCAKVYHGAWWYESCHNANLNGKYAKYAAIGGEYPIWARWKGKEALRGTLMMIRPTY
jgi:hypothetical protein